MYRTLIGSNASITLRRINTSPTPPTDKTVRARVVGFTPEELVGGITQGHRKIIMLAEDVESSGFPVPIKANSTDRVVVRGKTLMIENVDDSTRRVEGTLIAYEITASGA